MRATGLDTSAFYDENVCDVTAFTALIDQTTNPPAVPRAAQIIDNVPIYDVASLNVDLEGGDARRALLSEWATVFLSGPGVLVLRGAYADTKPIDQATDIYQSIIAQEKAGNGAGADHFAEAGANDRVWNALQKLCEHAPDVFLDYFANVAIAAVCEAWLGPAYQMTAQVNLVYPGGAAQQAHRDYHLGFQTVESCVRYPIHVHDLSPVLTLQGAIAHCDMPVDSGPTKLLPFSQAYRPGYMAWRREEFREVFEARCIQLPLAKGDALFFNPALFHAAGENRTKDIQRLANLVQVSSAMGRPTEAVDRQSMCKWIYPHALRKHQNGMLTQARMDAAVAACAEGYPFPTNLDTDPPIGGLAPQSQQAIFLAALEAGLAPEVFNAQLEALAAKQRP